MNPDPETPPKKLKRLCSYRKQWEKEYHWLTEYSASGLAKAYCNLCRKTFCVANAGLSDVRKHASGVEHKKHNVVAKQNQTLTTFLKSKSQNPDGEKVIATEIANVYHTVKHAHSYNSLQCSAKLSTITYDDSKIATKITLGRTKASSIAFNFLGPASLKNHLTELSKRIFFGLSSDASNHGSTKLFPILVRYYSPDVGIHLCLLDFFADPNETAMAVFSNIKEKIEKIGLSLKNVSSYSADNASVNFGCHHSVFQLMKRENPTILPTGCPAHMINNGVKNGLDRCEFDIEILVLKVYNHFSSHAKRVQELKDFCSFVDMEYRSVLRHVQTRWLSLLPAVERLLQVFPAIRSYFISLGPNCPVALKVYFPEEPEGLNNHTVTECYLSFFHNCLKIFHENIQLLEAKTLTCADVFQIFCGLRQKLIQRIQDEFVGFMCLNIIKSLPPTEQKRIKGHCLKFYSDVLAYIESKFDFTENNHLFKFKLFSLNELFTFNQLAQVVEEMGIDGLDMDQLYEEYCEIKNILEIACSNENLSPVEKWNSIFKNNKSLKNLLIVVQFVFSIFASNSDAERIFSMSEALWTDARNRLTTDHVKAELQIKVNFSYETCTDFYKFVLTNKALLRAAKSEVKYSFKIKN